MPIRHAGTSWCWRSGFGVALHRPHLEGGLVLVDPQELSTPAVQQKQGPYKKHRLSIVAEHLPLMKKSTSLDKMHLVLLHVRPWKQKSLRKIHKLHKKATPTILRTSLILCQCHEAIRSNRQTWISILMKSETKVQTILATTHSKNRWWTNSASIQNKQVGSSTCLCLPGQYFIVDYNPKEYMNFLGGENFAKQGTIHRFYTTKINSIVKRFYIVSAQRFKHPNRFTSASPTPSPEADTLFVRGLVRTRPRTQIRE